MNLEDYPLLMYEGRRLRMMPELPGVDHSAWSRCLMCLACPEGERNVELCHKLKSSFRSCSTDGAPAVYVPEDRFQDYVVELVRRRVSS